MLRDLAYAFRTFRRAPLAAVTIVVTVALGLGLVAAVFTFLNVFLFRVDEVRNPGELFGVERPRTSDDEPARFTRLQYESLKRETSVFSDAFAMLPGIDSRVDGRMMSAALVTGNFFQVLGVSAMAGRALLPEDDNRSAARQVVVLSHSGWLRQFAGDASVVGRSVVIAGIPHEIVGIMPKGFRGLSVGPPDFWAPLGLVGQFRRVPAGQEDTVGIFIIGRLKPGLSRQSAMAGLAVWDSAQAYGRSVPDVPNDPYRRERAAGITLEPRQGTVPQPAEALLVFAPLFFSFGLILMIGCANVANLLLARAVARQREIGIRLSLGASRRRIVRQLLTESLLLALAAAVLGFAASRLVLGAAITTLMNTMPPDIGDVRVNVPAADWRVALFLLGGAVASTVFFGLAPALRATRLDLVRASRGEIARDARPGRARHLLIGAQVTASALLLICSAVFLRSAYAAATFDPGIRTADNVIIEIVNEETRGAMIQAVTTDPSVAAVAASWPETLGRPRAAFGTVADAESSTGRPPAKTAVGYRFVSPEYFSVLGVPVIRGRSFTSGERDSSAAVAIVAESVARQLWPAGDAVGHALRLDPDPNADAQRPDEPSALSRSFTVVGVARDVAGFRIADFKEANVYVPIAPLAPKTSLTARVHGDPEVARRALLLRLTAVDPNMGQVITLRTMAGLETYFLQVAFWLTLVLGGLALALTLSGLFSVLSYLVEQRTKEIGVRMALGATAWDVTELVVWQSARPVAFGLVAGGGLAAALAIVLMTTPAAAQIGSIVRVFDPVAYASAILAIVITCACAATIPAWRAARISPSDSLRQD